MRTSSEERLFRCAACGVDKTSAEFSFADQERRILNAYCRVCHAAYRHAHYLANKADYVRRAIVQTKARREENRRQVLLYLATHPCVDCGNANVVTLEFDHRDRARKLTEVSRLIGNRRWPRVLTEIEKCDVRCINCHRRKTGREFGWAKVVAK
jgi:transcription elongation factor Elf1